METYSITGSLFGDDEAIVDARLFEDFPFSEDYTIIYQWRAGDIMDLLIEEGHINLGERDFSKIISVMVERYYNTDIEGLSLERPKAKMINEYTVGVSRMTSHCQVLCSKNLNIQAGANYRIEDMDRKIRDIKLNRIL
jgi:hypothetical protein